MPIPETQTSYLSINQLSVYFGQFTAIDNVSLNISAYQRLCLLGPSGCGKSTLLRAIAGFQHTDTGSIILGGCMLNDGKHHMPPEQRSIGMVFQDIALFPHLTVRDNVGFGLQKWSVADKQNRVDHLLGLVGLSELALRYPHELSGGQQQRIALIRAIAPKPSLLLLDEPFSGLDATLREALVPEVAKLLARENITAILVSHDQNEAFAFADTIAVMSKGRIEQIDSAETVYFHPATPFVAEFVGEGSYINGTLTETGTVITHLGRVEPINRPKPNSHTLNVFVRPSDVRIDSQSQSRGQVVSTQFRGAQTAIQIDLNGQLILSVTDSHSAPKVGDQVGLVLNNSSLLVVELEH